MAGILPRLPQVAYNKGHAPVLGAVILTFRKAREV